MCALFGWVNCGKKVPHKLLKKLTQELANAAEERGTDASGIAYVRNGIITVYKKPKPAHKVNFNIPDGITAVMGHTRFATQGDKRKNCNNHPFYGFADKFFALAHNGVLHNDTALRRYYNLPETNIATDSYIAVQLIEHQKRLDFESLKLMAEDVSGNFVFTVLDEDNTLYIVKGDNPIYLLYFEQIGLYVYASTPSIMENALVKFGYNLGVMQEIEVTEGDIIAINSNGEVSRSSFYLDERCYYSYYYDWLDSSEDYDNEEQLLLSMSNSLGLDENDVTLLLEYGYTASEIEDLIADTSTFKNVVDEIKLYAI